MNTETFKKICGNYVTGVTVICSKKNGQDFGFTANSFTSVSLDPLLILFCLHKNAKSNYALSLKNKFIVNILSDKQSEICHIFSDPNLDHKDRFKMIDSTESKNGIQIISESVAWIECDVNEKIDAGDHYIYVGKVIDGKTISKKNPLVYHKSKIKKII